MSKEFLKIKLKGKWDNPQCVDDNDSNCGVYWGRKQEKKRLKNIIKDKSRSSLLLCGPRGRGKTSLIHKTIREIKKEKKYRIIPVFINAPQLDAKIDENGDINYINILENIISSLNSSFRCSPFLSLSIVERIRFKCKLSKLYKKILASKWEKSKMITFFRLYFFKFENVLYILPIIISYILFKFFSNTSYIEYGIFTSIGIFLIIIVYRKVISRELYVYEKDFSNLEHYFKDLFQLKFKKLKFVFVIDELDFFMMKKDKENQIMQHLEDVDKSNILEIIKAYKNLFHYVSANFIFIGDDKLYDKTNKDNKSIYSTLFSESIYLPTPNQKDLLDYLDEIICVRTQKSNIRWYWDEIRGKNFCKQHLNKELKEKYELFKYYCMYLGKGDFRLTTKHLKDYIQENNIVLVKLNEFKVKEEAMAKTYRLMAKLYDSLSSEKPTKQSKNEEWYKSLYEIIDPEIWSKEGNYIENFYNADSEIKENQEFFITYLEELKIIEVNFSDDGSRADIRGSLAAEIPETFKSLTYKEKELEKKYNELEKHINNLGTELLLEKDFDKQVKWMQDINNVNLDKILSNAKEILEKTYKDIEEKEIRQITATEVIDPSIEELNSLKEQLEKSKFDFYRKKLDSELVVKEKYQEDQINNHEQLFNLLPDIKNELQQLNHVCFFPPNDFSKQLVLLDSDDNDLLERINNTIKEEELQFSYKVMGLNDDIKEVIEWCNDYEIFINKEEWVTWNGLPQQKNAELILNTIPSIVKDNSGNLNTFLSSNANIVSGFFECEIYLEKDGIFNLVISGKAKDDAVDYWLARLDTREGENKGSGLLKKNFNEEWEYVNQEKKNRYIPNPNKWVKIKVIFDEKSIKLYRYNEKGRRFSVESKSNKIDPGIFGFFNEVGVVNLKNIKYKFKISEKKD